MTGQRREVREEVTQPNTLNEKNKYKYKYKQRIIMKVFEMPSSGPNGIPGIPGSRDFELIKIPGFFIMKSRDFSGSA